MIICGECGRLNEEEAAFCTNCGRALAGEGSPAGVAAPLTPPPSGHLPPPSAGQQPPFRVPPGAQGPGMAGPPFPYPPYGLPPRDYPGYPRAHTDGMAVASLVVGIGGLTLGFFICPFPLVLGVLAIVFGYIGRNNIRDSGNTLEGYGFTTAGIVMGWVTIGLWLVIIALLIIAIIAGPNTSG